ncbi:hypothetical protein MMC25_002232 [Agyrium rufum]|nr:hypothetical protein [Agyrium rufum]
MAASGTFSSTFRQTLIKSNAESDQSGRPSTTSMRVYRLQIRKADGKQIMILPFYPKEAGAVYLHATCQPVVDTSWNSSIELRTWFQESTGRAVPKEHPCFPLRFGKSAIGTSSTVPRGAGNIERNITAALQYDAEKTPSESAIHFLEFQITAANIVVEECLETPPDEKLTYRMDMVNADHRTLIDCAKLKAAVENEPEKAGKVLQPFFPVESFMKFVADKALAPEKRPIVTHKPEATYQSFQHYATVLGQAALEEHELVMEKEEKVAATNYQLKLFSTRKLRNERYLGLLSAQDDEHLRVGDTLKVFFDDGTGLSSKPWSGVVLDLFPSSARSETSILLFRPVGDKNARTTTVVGQFAKPREAREFYDKIKSERVRVQLEVSSAKVIQYQFRAIKKLLEDPPLERFKRLLQGRNLQKLNETDLYNGVDPDDLKALLELSQLDESQRDAIQGLRRTRNGLAIVQGPPGSGKTQVHCQAIDQSLINNSHTEKTLIATGVNAMVEEVATRLLETIASLSKRSPLLRKKLQHVVVIRIYSLCKEKNFVAGNATPKPDPASTSSLTEDQEITAQLEAALFHYSNYELSRQDRYGVSDKRFLSVESSMGMWMLRLAGVVVHPLSKPNKWKDFRDCFQALRESNRTGVPAAPGVEETLRKEQVKLTDAILRKAEVVVTTLVNAEDRRMHENFRPRVVYIDEAARCIDPDVWIIIVAYVSEILVLFGDPSQLAPRVETQQRYLSSLRTLQNRLKDRMNGLRADVRAPPKRTNLGLHLAVSWMSRLINLNYPVYFLDTQHRMVPELSSYANAVFYEGRLIDGLATACEGRSTALTLLEFFYEEWGLCGNSVFLAMEGHVETFHQSHSRSNLANRNVVLGLVQVALKHVAPEDIVILTQYESQFNSYKVAIGEMVLKHGLAKFARIRVRKIDGFQGGEAPLVFLDLVVTCEHDLGFICNGGRLNVAITRAMDGLVVVGSEDAISSNDQDYSAYLNKFVDEFRDNEQIVTLTANDYKILEIETEEEGDVVDGLKVKNGAVEDSS